MTTTVTTPEAFEDAVQDALDKIRDGIQKGLNHGADTLNGMKHWSWLGGLAGMGGIAWAIKNFNKGVQIIWSRFQEVCTEIWDIVWDILGRPLDLQALAGSYQAARSKLTEQSNSVEDGITALGLKWSGDAFTAYSQVARNQSKAMAGVATGLDRAATLVAEAAEKLLNLWTDTVSNIVDLEAGIISAVASACNAANVITFETGPILNLVAAIVTGIKNVVKTFVDYLSGQGTTTANNWNSLNAGIDGLPDLKWPVVNPALQKSYSTPGEWAKD